MKSSQRILNLFGLLTSYELITNDVHNEFRGVRVYNQIGKIKAFTPPDKVCYSSPPQHQVLESHGTRSLTGREKRGNMQKWEASDL